MRIGNGATRRLTMYGFDPSVSQHVILVKELASRRSEGPTSESCFELGCFVLGGWVGLLAWVGLFRVRLWVVGANGEVSTAAAHASGRPPSVFLASPPSKACVRHALAGIERAT